MLRCLAECLACKTQSLGCSPFNLPLICPWHRALRWSGLLFLLLGLLVATHHSVCEPRECPPNEGSWPHTELEVGLSHPSPACRVGKSLHAVEIGRGFKLPRAQRSHLLLGMKTEPTDSSPSPRESQAEMKPCPARSHHLAWKVGCYCDFLPSFDE